MDMALASKASPPPWNATAAEQPIPKRDKAAANDSTYLNPQAHDSVLGIILGGGAGTRLYPLTKKRAKPAVPLGANYRLIDIPVSNCLNSNISKIYVLTQFNSASLNRHLSRAYGSNIGGYKNEGFVEVLAAQQSPDNPNWFQVDTTILGLDDVRAKEMPYIASMGIYVFSKDVMLQLLREQFPEANDFGSEVIPGATSIGKRVQAYLYDGYWEDIGTIAAFYNANLGITKKPIPDFSFYDRFAPIYTQPRHLPPSKVLDADVTDSVIGEGCVIKNCKINHSVVGLRSCISEGAIIEDSLLMGADYYEKLIKNSLPKKVAFLLVLGKIHASGEQSLTRMLELETMLRYSMLTMFKKLQWRQTGTSSKVELSQ
uniref:glucose-1-phosphate adenylyltransferase n=1 Tax=Zea mays TaxID=4577 RepID=A0A804NPV4_MAIZE